MNVLVPCTALLFALAAWPLSVAAAPSPAPSPAPSSHPAERGNPCAKTSALKLTTSPVCTVAPGHVDMENDYTNTTSTHLDGRFGNSVTYPQTLLRFGTSNPDFDLEFSAPSEIGSTNGKMPAWGSSDLGFGAKYVLGETGPVDWSVKAGINLPTGTSPQFSSGNGEFFGDFNYSYDIDRTFSLVGTIEFAADSAYVTKVTPQSYFNFQPTVNLNVHLPGPSHLTLGYQYDSAVAPNAGGASQYYVGYNHAIGSLFSSGLTYGWAPSYPGIARLQYIEAGLSIYTKL